MSWTWPLSLTRSSSSSITRLAGAVTVLEADREAAETGSQQVEAPVAAEVEPTTRPSTRT